MGMNDSSSSNLHRIRANDYFIQVFILTHRELVSMRKTAVIGFSALLHGRERGLEAKTSSSFTLL